MPDGLHTASAVLSIVPQGNSAAQGPLVCHYFPETATEEISAEYKEIKSAGSFMKSLMFMFGEPRTLSMKLLFNDWGESHGAGQLDVGGAISWVRSVIHPYKYGPGGFAASSAFADNKIFGVENSAHKKFAGQPPPILHIFFAGDTFVGHLKSATITYLKLSPGGMPIRAEIDVTFSQYTPIRFADQSASGSG